MALPKTGLQAAIEGLSNFSSGASTITKAYDTIEASASKVTKTTGLAALQFDAAAKQWRDADGRFASVKNTSSNFLDFGSVIGGLGSSVSTVGGQLVGLGDSLLKVGTLAGGAALAGVLALGAGIATLTVSGISQAKDLDQQMADIAATMGKTKEQVTPLKDEILKLSLDPNLKVNVTEAATAIQLLAQNGITMAQVLDGAATSTVELANSTGADFGVAADIATSVMQQFNIDAADMGTAVDGITGVVTSSKFDVNDYGLAIAQAGGLASSTGISLQDFNTVLAGTATQFHDGSDAGTSFRALLTRLASPTQEMITEMEKYGISLFDDNGKVRDLADVAGDLNAAFNGTATITETVGGATKKQAAAAETAAKNIDGLRASLSTNQKQLQLYNDQLSLEIGYYGEGSPKVRARQIQIEKLNNTINKQTGQLGEYEGAIAAVDGAQEKQITTTKILTDEEKSGLAVTLGGVDGQRTVLGLAKMTEDQFRKLSGEINQSGQASKAAATRVDSLSGAWEILQGIIQAIQIQVGDLFLPILRQVTSTLAGMATGNSAAIVAFFDSLITKGQELFTAFQKFGVGGLLHSLGLEGGALLVKEVSTLFGLMAGDAIALGDTLTSTLGAAMTWISTDLLPTLTIGIQFVIDHFEEFKGAILGVGAVLAAGVFAALVAAVLSLISPITLVIAGAALLGAAWAGNWGDIQGKTFAVWAVVQPILAELGAWLSVNIPIALAALATAWNTVLLPAITAIADFLTGTWFPLQVEWYNFLAVRLTYALGVLSTAWTATLLPAIKKVWTFVDTVLNPLWASLSKFLIALNDLVGRAMVGAWQNLLLPALTAVWDFITANIIPAFTAFDSTIGEHVTPTLSYFTDSILPPLTKAFDGIVDAIKDATSYFNGLAKAVNDFALPTWLIPGSPTPLETGLYGIADAADSAGVSMETFGASISMSAISSDAIDQLLGVDRNMTDAAASWNVTAMAIGEAGDALEDYTDNLDNVDPDKMDLLGQQIQTVFTNNQAAILAADDTIRQVNGLTEQQNLFLGLLPNQEALGISQDLAADAISVYVDGFEEANQTILDAQAQAAQDFLDAQDAMFIQAGHNAVDIGNSLIGVINSSAGVLDAQVTSSEDAVTASDDRIAALEEAANIARNTGQDVLFEGNTLSAVQIQNELTQAKDDQVTAQNALNDALEEQANIQDELLATQQAQADLDYLNAQLDLLDTINAAGLDAAAILGDTQLGLDASVEDIITATNNLLQAMVDQATADLGSLTGAGMAMGDAVTEGVTTSLGIASPSKVMQWAASETIAGFVDTLRQGANQIMAVAQRAIAAPAMVTAPAMATGAMGQQVSNTNFNMTVNTGATPQAVIGQYSIMQAMVG